MTAASAAALGRGGGTNVVRGVRSSAGWSIAPVLDIRRCLRHGLRRLPRRRGTRVRRRHWCGTAVATPCSAPDARAQSRSSSAAARAARPPKDLRAASGSAGASGALPRRPRRRIGRGAGARRRARGARGRREDELRIGALRPIAVAHGAVGRRRAINVSPMSRRAEQGQQEGGMGHSQVHDRLASADPPTRV